MSTALNDIYLPDDLFDDLVERLALAMPLLGSRDDIVTRVGEILNIWPERVAPEAAQTVLLRAA